MSRPVRALWIEIQLPGKQKVFVRSRPVRALWIEINKRPFRASIYYVEAREGLVD